MEKAIDALKKLPEERQKELAGYILDLADQTPVKLTDVERAAIDAGIADADAGRFASEEDYQQTLARLRSA